MAKALQVKEGCAVKGDDGFGRFREDSIDSFIA